MNDTNTTIDSLRPAAERLYLAQKVYEAAIQAVQDANGLGNHAICLHEHDAAYKVYRKIENKFVKAYNGTSMLPEVVWAAIEAGEAFPSFPYVWLPAGDYADWWDLNNPTVRDWWINETLIQAGFEREDIPDFWSGPLQAE